MTNKWWKATFATLLVALAALACPIAAHAEDPASGSMSAVYLAPGSGNDDASGATADDAVKTFGRAKDLLAPDGTIYLTGALCPTRTVNYSLEGKGNAKIKRYGEFDNPGPMLIVNNGVDVTLEHITFDGTGPKYQASESMVYVKGAGTKLTLGNGATLENSCVTKGEFGSAIGCWDGAKLVMLDGATVSGCKGDGVCYGAISVANGCTFDMQGGTITNNQSHRGGGVSVIASEMTMSGGTISNNEAYYVPALQTSNVGSAYGGAIYVSTYEAMSATPGVDHIAPGDATFTMTGGTISDNEALVYGGAICTLPDNRRDAGDCYINIEGGIIEENSSSGGSGGAIAVFQMGKRTTHLSITEGTIRNNTAKAMGGGIFAYEVEGDAAVQMSGGTLSGNTAEKGGGVYLYGQKGITTDMVMSGGSIVENEASAGGGVLIDNDCTLTMTGGTIEGNNGTKDQRATRGDGVYVGGTFEVADGENGGPVVDQNNDVYLPSGHVIDVIGSFSGATADNPINITSEEKAIEPEGGATPGTKLVNYHDKAGGEAAAQVADDNGIYVPSAKMLAQDPTLGIGKSEHASQLNYMTYVTEDPTLTLEVLDMTAYTGGDSLDDDPFPTPRYRARMNAQLKALLGSQDITDLQLTNASGEKVELIKVADGVYVAPALDEQYVYTGLNPDGRGARSAAADDAEAGVYTVSLASDERLEAGNVDGHTVEASVVPGVLTVRYVNDADRVAAGETEVTTPVITSDQLAGSDASSFRAVLDASAVLNTNNRTELGLSGTDGTLATAEPALLSDELLLADDGSSREPLMREKAEAYLGGQGLSTENRSWDFRYLDLVNASDGNAWIASSTGADVYWPYPEGTDEETQFTLVHYGDLYREYGINGVEDIASALQTSELSTVAVENTPYGIRFHVDTDGYGPFALSWAVETEEPGEPDDEKPEQPGQPDDSDDETPEEPGDNAETDVPEGDADRPAGDKGDAPEKDDAPDDAIPATGDASAAVAPVLLAGCAVAGLAALTLRRR